MRNEWWLAPELLAQSAHALVRVRETMSLAVDKSSIVRIFRVCK
jgi:hypothetical protein